MSSRAPPQVGNISVKHLYAGHLSTGYINLALASLSQLLLSLIKIQKVGEKSIFSGVFYKTGRYLEFKNKTKILLLLELNVIFMLETGDQLWELFQILEKRSD